MDFELSAIGAADLFGTLEGEIAFKYINHISMRNQTYTIISPLFSQHSFFTRKQ